MQNILAVQGFEPGIVQPAVHASNHSATTLADRMCLKYLFNVLLRSENYTSGRRVPNFGIVYTAAVSLPTM